jgi:hypothetical protein
MDAHKRGNAKEGGEEWEGWGSASKCYKLRDKKTKNDTFSESLLATLLSDFAVSNLT